MNKWVLITILTLLPIFAKAQSLQHNTDFSIFSPQIRNYFSTQKTKNDSLRLTDKKHSPHRATVYSALLPGLGQAYNRKYWKIPLIYAGLGGTGYFCLKERKTMRDYQTALILLSDKDSSTNPDSSYIIQPITQLKAARNLHRTNRDYLIIGLAGIYLINIVDAAIDAHFYNFNIDKPLGMQKTRHIYLVSGRVQNVPAFGLAYRF